MKIRSNRKNSVTAAETSDTGILSKIKNYVKKLYDINYGGSADFSNLNKVPVAVAYEGHTDNALGQIVLDLNKYRIVYEENGKAKNVIRKYNSLAEMWDALQNMDFDDYQNFLVYDTVESSTMHKPMRKTIKASASAKRRATQRVDAAKSLNMKAGLGRKSDWILRGYTVGGEDVDTLRIDFQDNVKQAVTDMFANPDIDTVDVYRIDTEQDTTGVFEDEEFFNTFTRNDIKASTEVNADLQLNKDNKKKYNWEDNPITDLDGYVKDIADGVVERFPNVTYEISDEAITFTDEDNNVIYVQPIDEIVPEKEDLENDILELGDAVQNEFSMSDWNEQAADEFESHYEDDPDYASRAVEMATYDEELSPIMGDDFTEDLGFGFDSNGYPIDESTVEALESIARSILSESEISVIDNYADINNFNYYASMPYVQESFNIVFTARWTGQEMIDKGFMRNDARMIGVNAEYRVPFNVKVKTGEVVDVDIFDVDVYSDGTHNGYDTNRALKQIDVVALKNFAGSISAPVASEIYHSTVNI